MAASLPNSSGDPVDQTYTPTLKLLQLQLSHGDLQMAAAIEVQIGDEP